MPVRKRNMLELLKRMLTGQNQFASGGLMLMVIGGLSVYLRAVPEHLWYWIVNQTTMMITVKDDDAAFVWVKEWFLEQPFLKRVRRIGGGAGIWSFIESSDAAAATVAASDKARRELGWHPARPG